MRAYLTYPGESSWELFCNRDNEFEFTVVIISDDTDDCDILDFVDTHTEMAARTVLDAINLGLITDWRQLYD